MRSISYFCLLLILTYPSIALSQSDVVWAKGENLTQQELSSRVIENVSFSIENTFQRLLALDGHSRLLDQPHLTTRIEDYYVELNVNSDLPYFMSDKFTKDNILRDWNSRGPHSAYDRDGKLRNHEIYFDALERQSPR